MLIDNKKHIKNNKLKSGKKTNDLIVGPNLCGFEGVFLNSSTELSTACVDKITSLENTYT
jgi:hypothetical protein